MKALALILLSSAVGAQTTVVVTDPYAGFAEIVKHNREQGEAAGRAAGNLVNQALRKPQAVSILLTIKCGKYVDGTVIYDNNTTKLVQFDAVPASDANLDAIRTTMPGVRVAAIDAGCS